MHGSYSDWIAATAKLDYYDWLMNGLMAAWILYALGRFLIGAYVARKGWIQRSASLIPEIHRIFWIALPLGLILEAVRTAISQEFVKAPEFVETGLHAIGVPILDTGYACGLILLLHSPRWKKYALAFAPVGRMALTNYLLQGVFIGIVLYGFHGGFALAGQIEPRVVLALCLAFFVAQMVFSKYWLTSFAFGPMEWLWRMLTYGSQPKFRRISPA